VVVEKHHGTSGAPRAMTEPSSRPTLRDVARSVNLHESTVSRILNGRAAAGRIRPETEQRVKLAAEELGYRGNTVARALRTGRTLMIGMVVPDIANLYQARITRAAQDVLVGGGYSLLLSSTGGDPANARRQIRAMISARTEGILYGDARLHDDVLEEILASGTPVVLVNRVAEDAAVSAVCPDNMKGTELAVRHLYELGHRVIVQVSGPQDISSGVARRIAFHGVLNMLQLEGDSEAVDRHTEAEGRRVAAALLERVPHATGVVAANDRLALGAIDAITERGLRCPEDISVVGFNDMLYAERLSPPLTTVRVPQHELGHRVAELLLETIRQPRRPPTREVVGCELIVRGSTMPARAPAHPKRPSGPHAG
jgi:LacI family transcriptional regulator